MSSINCGACDELRQHAPDFVQNGVTSEICTSLQNDTGLNPNASTLHDDAEDLHDANDCLVGRMDGEVEKFEVCDWKKYIHKLIPNIYEVIKGIICAIDGIWTNIHNLWKFSKEICNKVDAAISPAGRSYGAFPYNENPNRVMGEYFRKNGNPLLIPFAREEVANPDNLGVVGAGVLISMQTTSKCTDGTCQKIVWIMPWLFNVRITEETAINDILWYVRVDELLEKTGLPDAFVETFRANVPGDTGHGGGWTWWDGISLGATHKNAWIRLVIDPTNSLGDQYLVMQYVGSSYPNDAPGSLQQISGNQGGSYRVYRYNC